MNKRIREIFEKYSKELPAKTPWINQFRDEIDEVIEQIEGELDSCRTKDSIPQEINALNLELRQINEEQQLISANLKKAIAQLEPDSEILSNESYSSIDEATYLTESLIRLIEAHKKYEQELKERKNELEKLNTMLEEEKDELAEEKAKDQSILLSIGDGLVVTDKDAKIILTNSAFEKLIGYTQEEVIGKTISEIIKIEDQYNQEVEQSDYPHYSVIANKKSYISPADKTIYYLDKNNNKFPISSTINPIQIENEVIGAVEIFKDITIEKEIAKAKNEFVSLASHQLRTPLSSINWYVEMLLDDNLEGTEEEYKSYLNEIDIASRRMGGMINALLNVSRLELGTFAIEPEVVNIKDLIHTIVNDEKSKIIKKKLKVDGKFAEEMPTIYTDPKLLSMVIQNLLSNAVKYTPETGKITLIASVTKDNKMIISVRDTGYGIPKSEQEKIFSKLFRASNIKKHDTDGNGLGLYIVKLILDNLGGEISFTSEENKGTTFYFTLPLNSKKIKREGKKLT